MSWQPDKKEESFLRIILGMTTDCLLGDGVSNLSTYISNLKMYVNALEQIKNQQALEE
jgi:hypothetical protein